MYGSFSQQCVEVSTMCFHITLNKQLKHKIFKQFPEGISIYTAFLVNKGVSQALT